MIGMSSDNTEAGTGTGEPLAEGEACVPCWVKCKAHEHVRNGIDAAHAMKAFPLASLIVNVFSERPAGL